MKIKKTAVLFAAVCSLVAGSAFAQDSGTLKKIKDTGVIALGHRESSIPFSYYDENQKVVGYARDVQMAVVDAVKKKVADGSVSVPNTVK